MTPALALLLLASCLAGVLGAAVPNAEEPAPQPPEAPPDPDAFRECLRRDSIKCLQQHAFRSIHSFLGQERVRLGAGLELVREGAGGGERAGREAVRELPDGVEEREEALEAFAVDGALRFLGERSLRWNPKEGAEALQGLVSTARDVANAVSASGVGAKIGDFISQGRGKKILKVVIPILVGMKIKVVILMVLTYFAIALIAKKAILASLISLIISAVIGIRKLLDRHQHYHPHHVATTHHVSVGHADHGHHISPHIGGHVVSGGPPYHGPSGPDYESDHYGGDHYAAHSSPVAHVLAYGGQKPGLR